MDNTLMNLIQGRDTSSKNVAKEMSPEPLQRHKQINKACLDTFIFFSRAAFFGHFFSAIFFEQFFQFWVLSPCSGRQKQISEAWSDPLISGALPSSCTAHHGSIAMSCFQLENIIFRLRSRFEFIPPKGNVSAKLAKLSGFSTKHNQNRFQVFACLYFGGKIVF